MNLISRGNYFSDALWQEGNRKWDERHLAWKVIRPLEGMEVKKVVSRVKVARSLAKTQGKT